MSNQNLNVADAYGVDEEEVVTQVYMNNGTRGETVSLVGTLSQSPYTGSKVELRGTEKLESYMGKESTARSIYARITGKYQRGVTSIRNLLNPRPEEVKRFLGVAPLSVDEMLQGTTSKSKVVEVVFPEKNVGLLGKYHRSKLGQFVNANYSEVEVNKRLITFLTDVGMNVGIVATLGLVLYTFARVAVG